MPNHSIDVTLILSKNRSLVCSGMEPFVRDPFAWCTTVAPTEMNGGFFAAQHDNRERWQGATP